MEVRLLGPVEIAEGSRTTPLHGGKQRTVLGLLALASGRVVPVSRLVDAVWADSPPASAHRQILNTVSGLRSALAAAVVTTPAGYVLDPDRAQTDLAVFEATRATAAAAAADGQPAEAARLLRAALALWRGPALGGAPGLAAESARLEEQRLTAIEERIDADLLRGEHRHLVAELTALVADHPLRERLRVQMMLVLHRCGRSAEALASYQGARRMMIGELGLEPGPELRRLQLGILAGDPKLDPPTPAEAAAVQRRSGPGRPAGSWRPGRRPT